MTALTIFTLNNNTTVTIVPAFPTSNVGHVVVTDATTNTVKSATMITDSKPLEDLDAETLDRVVYIQSHNSELDLTDEQREQLRSDLLSMYSNKAWMSEDHWEYFETNDGVIGGLMLDHVDGKLVQVTVVVRSNALGIDAMSALHLDKGPVNFTETYVADEEFLAAMTKLAEHAMAKA